MNSAEKHEKLFENFTQLKKHLKSIIETAEVYKCQQAGFAKFKEEMSNHKDFKSLNSKHKNLFDEKAGADMLMKMELKWNCTKESILQIEKQFQSVLEYNHLLEDTVLNYNKFFKRFSDPLNQLISIKNEKHEILSLTKIFMKKLDKTDQQMQAAQKDHAKGIKGSTEKLVQDVHDIIMKEIANIQTFNLAYKNFDNIDQNLIYETYVQLRGNISSVKERHKNIEKCYFDGMLDIERICRGAEYPRPHSIEKTPNHFSNSVSAKNGKCSVGIPEQFSPINSKTRRNGAEISPKFLEKDTLVLGHNNVGNINYSIVLETLNSKVHDFKHIIQETKQYQSETQNEKEWMLDAQDYNNEKLKKLKTQIMRKMNEIEDLQQIMGISGGGSSTGKKYSQMSKTDKMNKLLEEVDDLSNKRKQLEYFINSLLKKIDELAGKMNEADFENSKSMKNFGVFREKLDELNKSTDNLEENTANNRGNFDKEENQALGVTSSGDQERIIVQRFDTFSNEGNYSSNIEYSKIDESINTKSVGKKYMSNILRSIKRDKQDTVKVNRNYANSDISLTNGSNSKNQPSISKESKKSCEINQLSNIKERQEHEIQQTSVRYKKLQDKYEEEVAKEKLTLQKSSYIKYQNMTEHWQINSSDTQNMSIRRNDDSEVVDRYLENKGNTRQSRHYQ